MVVFILNVLEKKVDVWVAPIFLNLLFFSFLMSALGRFLSFAMQKGQFLYGYFKQVKLRCLYFRFNKHKIKQPFWQKILLSLYKPLGGCVYCYTGWLGIVLSIILKVVPLAWVLFLPSLCMLWLDIFYILNDE